MLIALGLYQPKVEEFNEVEQVYDEYYQVDMDNMDDADTKPVHSKVDMDELNTSSEALVWH